MSRHNLRTFYPGCAELAEWLEDPRLAERWEQLRKKNMNPRDQVESEKRSADECLALNRLPCRFGCKDASRLRGLRRQMDHPDFLKYMIAKLGAL